MQGHTIRLENTCVRCGEISVRGPSAYARGDPKTLKKIKFDMGRLVLHSSFIFFIFMGEFISSIVVQVVVTIS